MKIPLVSIIILNFNGLEDTINCLTSLKKTRYRRFEIILIDNGSETNQAKLLKKKFGTFIKAFRLKNNLGFTGGNNWALKKTIGKYVIILNNDTIVEPNWIEPLVNLLEKNKQVAVVQPKIKLMKDKTSFDYAGAAGGYIDKYGYPFTRGRIFSVIEKDTGQYDGECEIFWASGAACIIKKSIIKKVGGLFKEDLFNYMEEIDFCWRTWNRGYKVMFTSKSVIYHKGASTASKNLFLKRYWEHRNNLIILTRNLNLSSLLKIIPIRAFLEIITYLRYLTNGEYTYIVSLFMSHLDFIKRAVLIRYKRDRLPNRKDLPIYGGSIVFEYFVNKKTRFSLLNWSLKGNIAFLVYNLKSSGGMDLFLEQSKFFINKVYPVTFYFISPKIDSNITLCQNQRKNILFSFIDKKSDVLISTFWPTSFLALFIRARKKFYFVLDTDEFYKENLIRYFINISYILPFEKIVISKYLKEKIQIIQKKYKVHHIPYSLVDTSIFKMLTKKPHINKKTINVISVISWYKYYKGPDLLVKVVRNLKKIDNRYKFTLVSREKKTFSNVFDHFYSNIPSNKLAYLYNSSDFLISTSRAEGFYIPGLEAMACGCPVITTNCGGVNEYILNGKNGVILNKLEDLWEKDVISKLLENKNKLAEILNNGLKTAKKYRVNNPTNDLERIFFHT